MAGQISSGTAQRENTGSDQISDVSATQKNLCDQATTEFVLKQTQNLFCLLRHPSV